MNNGYRIISASSSLEGLEKNINMDVTLNVYSATEAGERSNLVMV